MDEKKKSEASGEEPERLGRYVIQEQVQQSHDSQEGLYVATHEESGDKVLGRKHPPEERAAQGKSWRVLLECWASEGYSLLHVQFTEWARALDRQSAESLLLTLEAVLEEVRRMLHAAYGPPEPRPRWHLGLGVASAVTVCALLVALVYRVPVSQFPSAPSAAMSHKVLTATETSEPDFNAWLADTADAGQFVLARPLPKEPLKGQKRPPALATSRSSWSAPTGRLMNSRPRVRRPSSSTRASATCLRSARSRRPRHLSREERRAPRARQPGSLVPDRLAMHSDSRALDGFTYRRL